jgi:hypothetical protein
VNEPLDAGTIDLLTSNPASALAACFIVARSHPHLLQFVARICGPQTLETPIRFVREHPASRRGRKTNGQGNGGAWLDSRIQARNALDDVLARAIEAKPGMNMLEMCAVISRSSNTVKAALRRLSAADRITQDANRKWRTSETAP